MISDSKACHVCAGVRRRNLYRQDFSGLSSGTFLHGYDVCVCEDCGFVFAGDLPAGEDFDRYYAEMSKWEHLDNAGTESPEDARRFADTAQFVARFRHERDAPVLDVGCSTGGLLAALRREGFTQLLGLDPSPQCAELARRNYGIEVFTGTVKALNQLPEHFGLVTLSGVLEHLYDPNTVLQDVAKRLADGGLLYVSVPDATRFAQYMDAPYQQFSIEHILFFTPNSLGNLLRRNGFVPLQMRQVAYPYTLSYHYPSVEGVFQNGPPGAWTRDDSGERTLRDYLTASAAWDEAIAQQIADLVQRQEPILVWGVGTNTQRLMAATRLREANIVAFVDSNPHYHGKELQGRPIISPQDVAKHSEPILIASIIYREEISRQIRNQLKLDSRLIMLETA
jgi:SAM-dependent methyltransferase